MQSSPSSWRSALRAAFPHTVPILAGFLVLGVTYGMLMQAIGYGPLWSGLFSAIAFGGRDAVSSLFPCWRRASIRWRCSC
ncbi:MAG: hypothetical protein ACLSHM_01080 [Vescimonas sp.]